MKKNLFISTLLGAVLFSGTLIAKENKEALKSRVSIAETHLQSMVDSLDAKDKIVSPRTFVKGRIEFHGLESWTSGFFPGSLWYLYELSGDKKWLPMAEKYTEGMGHIKYYKGNHDIGFMINCSFGNALRLTNNEKYKEVLTTAAETLTLRFKKGAGIIQSWDSSNKWKCPVIIDNMMNLELLFEATKLTGDKKYWDIAISHADVTMANHYREDNSCFHVINYDPETGEVLSRNTHQGYSDPSAWSRGQAWGLYGYVLCYRYTKDEKYLAQAKKIVEYIFNNPTLPSDLVPYWDYNLHDFKGEPRDASAAAITASALYEMSTYVKDKKLKSYADKIVESLSSDVYTAKAGENGHFILLHSTGSKPHKSEIDTPLVYADYYYLEALKRKHDLEK